ncbi:family 36 putative glycoside hydrolase [Cercophora samala]|uniref:Family 36 putative glycoside hydrolase n=1 Tax=Cercophora samala TaxID=330535 RepID=A0AA40D956_9PEZI|nr:family 36 putative glycoside hydrolase [Cercophora samala]
MALTITCHPPLGAIHVLEPDVSHVQFVVGAPSTVSDVTIWHNCTPTSEWSELGLTKSTTPPLIDNQKGRKYFTGAISVLDGTYNLTGPFKFTVKLRDSKDASWLWIKDLDGSQDGEVVVPALHPPSSDLSSYLDGISKDIVVDERAGTNAAAETVWKLKANTPAAHGQLSGRTSYSLGKAIDCIRWFAIVRHNDAWFGPRHGREVFSLNEEAVMLSFLRRDGLHVVIIAISGVENLLTTVVSSEHGHILLSSRNDGLEPAQARVVVAIAETCEKAIAAAMRPVREFTRCHSNNIVTMDLQKAGSQNVDVAATLQSWYDGFAYCTWNGLGQYLSPSKILDALTSLDDKGVRLTTLIIDDNWQSVQLEPGKSDFYRQWSDFEANKEHFPGGLKSLITTIRSKFPYIQFIAVWHGIFGHWGGMAPDSNIGKDYAMRTFKRREGIFLGGGKMTTVEGTDAVRLYDDFYKFLSDAGVDAVKVDTQSFLDYAEHADDRLALTTAYQDAWRLASLKYFGGRAIACMAQIPQTIFYSFLRDDLPKPMVRTSDDFFPDDPSSHSWHIFCNAHNALLMQHFHLLPDWDMFQTKHQYSRFHATARCVSGGPIYITDAPGDHDLDLIGEMIAKTPDGSLVVLRTEKLGRTVEMYTGHSETTQFLQIRAEHHEAVITAVFNLYDEPLTKLVSLGYHLKSAPAKDEAGYLFRVHSSGRVLRHAATPGDTNPPIMELHLGAHDSDIITRHPIRRFKNTKVAVLGLLGKMAGAAAVVGTSYTVLPKTSEIQVEVQLRALGSLGVYVSADSRPLSRPVKATVGGGPVAEVEPSASDPFVLEFDLETLWPGGDRNAKVGSEVLVTLVIPML